MFIKGDDYDLLKDFKYRILETFTHQTDIIPPAAFSTNFSSLDESGLITIEKGFLWDGASGAMDTPNIMRGSCLHDMGCNAYLLGLISDENRKQFDTLLYEIILKDDMPDFRAKYVYEAVKANTRIRYKI